MFLDNGRWAIDLTVPLRFLRTDWRAQFMSKYASILCLDDLVDTRFVLFCHVSLLLFACLSFLVLFTLSVNLRDGNKL